MRRVAFRVVIRLVGASLLATAVLVNWRGPSGQEPATSQAVSAASAEPSVPAPTVPVAARVAPVSPTTTSTGDGSPPPDGSPPLDASPVVVLPTAELARVTTHPATLVDLDPAAVVLPVRVSVAGTDIDGPVVPTGVDPATGELAVFPDARVVGWYQFGPRPGDAGSAVLASHLDWRGRPGVFIDLAKVEVGQVVSIAFSDGTSRSFRVVDRQLVDKGVLSSTDVFTRVGPPRLRLITCGGSFDRSTRHYRSNVVVTAEAMG